MIENHTGVFLLFFLHLLGFYSVLFCLPRIKDRKMFFFWRKRSVTVFITRGLKGLFPFVLRFIVI